MVYMTDGALWGFWAEHKWLGGILGEQGLLASTGMLFGDCAAAPAGLNGG